MTGCPSYSPYADWPLQQWMTMHVEARRMSHRLWKLLWQWAAFQGHVDYNGLWEATPIGIHPLAPSYTVTAFCHEAFAPARGYPKMVAFERQRHVGPSLMQELQRILVWMPEEVAREAANQYPDMLVESV